ncbi:MAG: NAD(P)H-dependent flavin oxidoreductase [Sciscionella sp.]
MGTWLTERFSLRVPLVGAPMAGPSGGELAAAISRAGGLGMIGAGAAASPQWITEQARAAEGTRFGIGLMAWSLPDNPGQLDAVIAARPVLVSVSYGDYQRYVKPLQENGIAVATQSGTVADARAAEQAGVDLVVARGGEAGGHGRDTVATLPLLQAVLDAIEAPVLAAGGIATGRGLAAVLAAGAAGAWVGTAFLACTEAANTAEARARVLASDAGDTAYGRVFDIGQRLGWPPEFGGRALRNDFFQRWSGREDELAADHDAQAELVEAKRSGDFDTAYIYAGQSVGLLREQRPAAQVVAELASAADLLRSAAGSIRRDS